MIEWSPGSVASLGKPSVVPVVALDASADTLSEHVDGAVTSGEDLFVWT